MSGRRIALALVAVVGGVAHADPVSPADAKQAAADARQGRARGKAHKYAEACPKLEASQKLAPSLVTETELAECDDKIGKIASALAAYRDVIAREPNSRRRKAAVDLVAQLDQRVPRIIVNVEADAEVTLDGAPLAATAQGAPVDFGKHEIVATKPGRVEFHKNVTITDEGQVVTINAKLPEAAAGAVASSHPNANANANANAGAKPPTPTPTPTPTQPRPATSHRKTYAVATIGVGGAGLVTGIVFGAFVRLLWFVVLVFCGGSTTGAAQDEADAAGKHNAQAHTHTTQTTNNTNASRTNTAAGIVLFATAPNEHEVQV